MPRLLRFYVFSFLALSAALSWFGLAQDTSDRAALEEQRKQNLWKIKKTRLMLEEISQKKQSNLSQLSLMREQIKVQEQLSQVIQQEIASIETDIRQIDKKIEGWEEKLTLLKNEYGQMIYLSAKSTTALNRLNFVFASSDLNQLYRRIRYIQQYQKARKNQALHIQDLATKLELEKEKRQKIKSEKEQLLTEKLQESRTLEALLAQKNQLTVQLAGKEKELKRELWLSKKNLGKLETLIEDMVAGGNTSTRPRTKPKQKAKAPISPARLTKLFANRRGKLMRPTAQGFVASRFGKQEHPVLEGVMIDNSGIDLQCKSGQKVRAVYQGEISTIANIPGMGGDVIMIQHGDYFSVYAKVKDIQVSTGDWVETGQEIATVHTDHQQVTRLQFQIWKGSTKLNPETWLGKN